MARLLGLRVPPCSAGLRLVAEASRDGPRGGPDQRHQIMRRRLGIRDHNGQCSHYIAGSPMNGCGDGDSAGGMVPPNHCDAGLPYVCQDTAKPGRRETPGIRNTARHPWGRRLRKQFLQQLRSGVGQQYLPDGGGPQRHASANPVGHLRRGPGREPIDQDRVRAFADGKQHVMPGDLVQILKVRQGDLPHPVAPRRERGNFPEAHTHHVAAVLEAFQRAPLRQVPHQPQGRGRGKSGLAGQFGQIQGTALFRKLGKKAQSPNQYGRARKTGGGLCGRGVSPALSCRSGLRWSLVNWSWSGGGLGMGWSLLGWSSFRSAFGQAGFRLAWS